MLWRLENAGVAVAARWDELADKAEKRVDDHLLVFADLHFVLALAAAGRGAKLDRMIESMHIAISTRRTTQEQVLAEVGAALAQAIRVQYQGDYELSIRLMLPLRYRVRDIGGSHAQRDIFSKMLIEAALKNGKHGLARALLHERIAVKPGSARSWNLLADAFDCEGKASDAAEARSRAEQLREA